MSKMDSQTLYDLHCWIGGDAKVLNVLFLALLLFHLLSRIRISVKLCRVCIDFMGPLYKSIYFPFVF